MACWADITVGKYALSMTVKGISIAHTAQHLPLPSSENYEKPALPKGISCRSSQVVRRWLVRVKQLRRTSSVMEGRKVSRSRLL